MSEKCPDPEAAKQHSREEVLVSVCPFSCNTYRTFLPESFFLSQLSTEVVWFIQVAHLGQIQDRSQSFLLFFEPSLAVMEFFFFIDAWFTLSNLS